MESWKSAAALILAAAMVISPMANPNLAAVANGGTAALQTSIGIATSAGSYAASVVRLASSHGLPDAGAVGLLSSGNASLAAAEQILSAGGNLTEGARDASLAMSDFTGAAAAASLALQSAGLIQSTGPAARSSSVASLNQTASYILSVLSKACPPPASAPAGQQYCSAATALLANATAEIRIAALQASAGDASSFDRTVALVRADLGNASADVGALSAFSYASRGEAFVQGPLASQARAANASVNGQEALMASFNASYSAFRTDSASQAGAAEGVATSASAVASAISAVDVGAVAASSQSEVSTLSAIAANLTAFYQALPSLLPLATLGTLKADTNQTQADLSAYESALLKVKSDANSFQEADVGGVAAYASTFETDAQSAEASGQVFLSAYAQLLSDLSLAVAQNPLLGVLATWQTALTGLSATANTDATQTDSSLQSASNGLVGLQSATDSLGQAIALEQSQPSMSGILGNLSSCYVSEESYLNSTGMSSIAAAIDAVRSTQDLAGNFSASASSLPRLTLGGFASGSASLGAQADAVGAQGQAALLTFSSASRSLSFDLMLRQHAVDSARAYVAQALQYFAAQEVPQGVASLNAASEQFALATSVS